MGDSGVGLSGSNDRFDYNEIYESNYRPDPGCGCSGGGKWWGTLNADIVGNAFVDDSPGGGAPVQCHVDERVGGYAGVPAAGYGA
jgi:hypothetical protein